MSKKFKLIKKTDLIGEILEKNPNTPELLLPYGLHCIGCSVNPYESLEAGCKAHGFDDKTIDEIVEKLNKDLQKNAKTT